jgi:hypothetical protein
MFFEFIDRALAAGYRRIDFGRTPLGAGTYEFKRQWLAEETPLIYQYLGNNAEKFAAYSIQAVQRSFAFKLFASVWSRFLPRAIIESLGPELIKRMPLA